MQFSGMPVDIDNLGLFQSFTSIHTWTSTTILNNQALIVTRKATSVVTLEELKTLASHLGVSLNIDASRNGRLWAFKVKGHVTLSNQNFNELPREESINTTTCKVAPDVLSWHTNLEKLVSQAKSILMDFQNIHSMFPELHLLSDTCFMYVSVLQSTDGAIIRRAPKFSK